MRYLEILKRSLIKAFLLITICFLVPSCSEKTENKQKETEGVKTEKIATNIKADLKQNIPATFQEFLNFVPTRKLPVKTGCSVNEQISHHEVPTKYKKWLLPQSGIYGKLEVDSDFHIIIHTVTGDEISPYIFTYDSNGNKIDSLTINQGYCGADESFNSNMFVEINKSLEIILTDSTSSFDYTDTKHGYNRTLDSTNVVKQKALIKEDGTFTSFKKTSSYLVTNRTIQDQSIIYYWAPNGKLEKMKEKFGEENFNTSVDDVVFYSSQLQELVDSLGIKSYKDSVGTIGFIGTHREYQANLAKSFEGEIFGAIYFDGVNPPVKLNLLEPKISTNPATNQSY